MRGRPLIQISGRDNGAGLSRDLALVVTALTDAGMRAEPVRTGRVKHMRWIGEWGLRAKALLRGRADLQISLERVSRRVLPLARANVLIPNPEWFTSTWIEQLPHFDRILCKTRDAERIFTRLGCVTEYIGFTSEDRLDPTVRRERAFFHLAGRSSAKGTEVLLNAWCAHPEWPLLTVVQSQRKARPRAANNIRHIVGYVDDAELRRLQNQHSFHVCASEVEGFGHYLMEALAVGAVVLTTDGAPMNELVSAERGILIPAARQVPQQLGMRHLVDETGIEHAVNAALALPAAQVAALASNARNHFVAADRSFRQTLPDVVSRLVAAGARIPDRQPGAR